MRRICILTQPLRNNYGGLLQAYALQTILKNLGHEVWTEDRSYNNNLKRKIKNTNFVRRLFKKETLAQEQILAQHTQRFVRENMQTTVNVASSKKSLFDSYNFDCYVVGSDQVWRPKYSPDIYNYFLDFTTNMDVRRIAYAASFGTEKWEMSKIMSARCKKLAKNFDFISVREDSAVGICKKQFEVEPLHVLDPTLLLEKEHYISLVEKDNIPKSRGNLSVYILGNSSEKKAIVDRVAKDLNLSPQLLTPKYIFKKVGVSNINDCIFPAVTSWLRGFMDAYFVVTDSFHGIVFSIIFNKEFIAIKNKSRGISRMNSILKIFGLTDRLISTESEVCKEHYQKIDYKRVNEIKKEWQNSSVNFLIESLK
ncbi:MAG: polysaccharide pyruvyl transferase family protein [Rikenellaceae bacterium]